jgi:hypothetical protein
VRCGAVRDYAFVLQRSERHIEGDVADWSIGGAVEPCYQIGVAQGSGLQNADDLWCPGRFDEVKGEG